VSAAGGQARRHPALAWAHRGAALCIALLVLLLAGLGLLAALAPVAGALPALGLAALANAVLLLVAVWEHRSLAPQLRGHSA
jgi:hypothetical protein